MLPDKLFYHAPENEHMKMLGMALLGLVAWLHIIVNSVCYS